jgi:hypothetical protein
MGVLLEDCFAPYVYQSKDGLANRLFISLEFGWIRRENFPP